MPGPGFPVSGGSTSTLPIIGVTGADPTGNTDSTGVINTFLTQAALTGTWSLNNTAGAQVLLPPGQYLIGTGNIPLLLAPGVRLVGSGKSNTMLTIAGGTTTDGITNGVCDVNGIMQNAFSAYTGADPTPAQFVVTSVSGSGPGYILNVAPFSNTSPVIIRVGMMGYLTGSGTANQHVYTVTSVNAGAGTIGITVPAALGAPNTGNFFIIPGAIGASIEQMTINGNQNAAGTRQGGGWNVRLYGQGHTLQQCCLIAGATGNMYSEGTANSGSFTWPQAAGVPMYDVQSSGAQGVSGQVNSGYGIEWQGPHDSKWFNVSSSSNNAHGLWLTGISGKATATKMFGCYFFFNNTANGNFTNVFVDLNANATSMYDCQIGQNQGGASSYDLWVDGPGFDMCGGEIIGGPSVENGIRIGNQGAVTGLSILRTLIGPAGGGIGNAINFVNDSGGNFVDVTAGAITTVNSTGPPNIKTRMLVRGTVNSNINMGSVPAALLPGGSATPTSGTTTLQGSGADMDILITATGITGAGNLTVNINSNAAGANGQTLQVLTVPTGTTIFGPYTVLSARYITLTWTATGGSWAWSGIGH